MARRITSSQLRQAQSKIRQAQNKLKQDLRRAQQKQRVAAAKLKRALSDLEVVLACTCGYSKTFSRAACPSRCPSCGAPVERNS
ncbi:MAG: hypothetical protein ACQEXJ_06155 [Myxococcota bacterium]